MLIPYKVKNPIDVFPYATISLIVLNIVVYALTSEYFLIVKHDAVDRFALVWGVSPLYTILTAMFLHGDIFHLAGNMLFLWVFGPAVEDRLKIPAFLGLYFFAGFAGDVAQAALGATGALGVDIPIIGASGCIMGVLGAYWYLYSWSKVCMFYWVMLFWRGTFEVAAIWVIGAYFVMDLVNGFIGRAAEILGGTANFAHVGGAFIGAFLVWILGGKRDTEDISRMKAIKAEAGGFMTMTCYALKDLLMICPDDEDLLLAYAKKSIDQGDVTDVEFATKLNKKLILSNVPDIALKYYTAPSTDKSIFDVSDLLVLARWCESKKYYEQTFQIYREIEAKYPTSSEAEMALYRVASLYWHSFNNHGRALGEINKLQQNFPNGRLVLETEDLKKAIETSQAA
ncbi:MAG: rhomboid family intramembrane serine protease [Armatimonadota bacterium]